MEAIMCDTCDGFVLAARSDTGGALLLMRRPTATEEMTTTITMSDRNKKTGKKSSPDLLAACGPAAYAISIHIASYLLPRFGHFCKPLEINGLHWA